MRTVEEIHSEMQSIVDASEERSMTDDEVTTYEGLEAELQSVQKSDEIRSRQAAYSAPAVIHSVKTDDGKDDLTRAFEDYLRTGRENADLTELRAQSVGTDSAGGFTVPSTMRSKLVEVRKRFGGLANVAEVFNTSDGAPISYPSIDDTGNLGSPADENTAPTGGADLVFGEVNLGSFKYMAPGENAKPLAVSVELLQDSAFDIGGLVSRKLGQRIARLQASDFVSGSGTGEPQGIITPAATTANLTYDDLVDAMHSVDPEYRESAVWVFNDSTLAALRKLKDNNNNPLWLSGAGLENLPGGTLLDHPVVIDQAFSNSGGATPEAWGVFGDIAEGYVIRRVGTPTIIVDPYTAAAKGQVLYTMWDRADARVQNASAYSVLVTS